MEQLTISLVLTGLALFAYWATYIMGDPLEDKPRPTEILAFIPYRLAVRRMKRLGLWKEALEHHAFQMKLIGDVISKLEQEQAFRKEVLMQGRKAFTWERAILCPVCLHWWLTVLAVGAGTIFDCLYTREHLWLVALIYLVNHLFIRKIV